MPYIEPTEEQKLEMCNEAISQKLPVIFCYYSKEGNISARAVLIDKVAYNQRGQLYINGFDSLSRESRSFIIRNTQSFHLLAPQEPVNTQVDWNDVSILAESGYGTDWSDFKFNREEG